MDRQVSFQITGFEILDCRYGRATSPAQDLPDVLSRFSEWVNSTEQVEQTLVLGAGEVYVKDVARAGDSFAIVLWKKNGTRNTTYALCRTDPPDGTASITINKFGKNFIPGDPLYFMVNVAKKRLYTLRPPYALLTGRKDLEQVIKGFMLQQPPQGYSLQVQDGTEIVDISSTGAPPPVFKAKLVRNDAVVAEIIKNCKSIRKLVHDITLKGGDHVAREKYLKPLISFFSPELALAEFDKTRKIRYEIDVELEEQHVQQILDEQENAPQGKRVGFKFKKDDRTHWADSCIDRFNMDLVFTRNTDIFSSKDILNALKYVI